ncbi:hypothetical protein QR680_018412 [Steinernema hermaphroditum]|uniref:Uncharacterized protein n=1 Tax=Steinernema hermaphroditum TaxID=289476 RepID=A0AA39HHW6_9BILA|nr:hypothetical protein QR680_018412 [Steinernema hermaphroditum]
MSFVGLLVLVAIVVGILSYVCFFCNVEDSKRKPSNSPRKTTSTTTSAGETLISGSSTTSVVSMPKTTSAAASSKASSKMKSKSSSPPRKAISTTVSAGVTARSTTSKVSPPRTTSAAATTEASSKLTKTESAITMVTESSVAESSKLASRFLSSDTASITTVSSMTMCDCGSDQKIPMDDIDEIKDIHVARLLRPTVCYPIDYELYKPVAKGLLSLIDPSKPSGLCEAAQKPHAALADLKHFSAFKPILHAIHYAHKHSKMVNELCENYAYIESG